MKLGHNAMGTVIGLVQGIGYTVPTILVSWGMDGSFCTEKRYMFYMGNSFLFQIIITKGFSIVAVLLLLKQVIMDRRRIQKVKRYYKIKRSMDSKDDDSSYSCDDDIMQYV